MSYENCRKTEQKGKERGEKGEKGGRGWSIGALDILKV